jgi:hypothetical protein
MLTRKQPRKSKAALSLWFERLMALLALANLGLVVFDLTYVPWRDVYLRYVPALTSWYGHQFKGIEPHRDTEAYLETVDRLKTQVADTGLRSPEAASLLDELRTLSDKMIDENPFELANKSGTLERIKNEMRDRTRRPSSKQAFNTFWSQSYLSETGWTEDITFFDRKVRPLMERNYFRNIDESGGFIDRFWQIDIWFVGLFAAEFLARTLYLSRRYRGVNWLDAMLWRWYDLFLLIPFWRWLRIIPVTIRLNDSQIINLNPLRTRINHWFVASFAVELTEIVVLRIIEQTQGLIRQGSVRRWLLKPETHHRYIDINGVDEVQAISSQLIDVVVYKVLPKIKPDLDALIQHTLISVLQQLPAYKNLQTIPGFSQIPQQLTAQIAAEVSENVYGALVATLQDSVGEELVRRLVEDLGQSFRTEIQQDQTLDKLEGLVSDLLDEIKINYVKQVAAEDITKLREQSHQFYRITQGKQS